MDSTSRRRFLGVCLGGIAAGAAAAVVYPVYRYLAPRGSGDAAAKVVIAEAELPDGGAKFFEYAGSAAVLVRTKEGRVVALSAVCTHLGCIVQWEKDRQDFLCPCHGGRYSAEGTVTAGPPPKPLAPLPVTVANGTVTIG